MVFSQAQVECCAWEERSPPGAVSAGLEGVSQFECYVIQDSQSIATLHLGVKYSGTTEVWHCRSVALSD